MKTETVFFENIENEITYYIGKNAKDNFCVIDIGGPDDIWFHAKEISSCHVVAKIPDLCELNKKELHTIIKKGALICKQNTSKLINSTGVEIIYTSVKNITKTNIDGCVITDKIKTIIC